MYKRQILSYLRFIIVVQKIIAAINIAIRSCPIGSEGEAVSIRVLASQMCIRDSRTVAPGRCNPLLLPFSDFIPVFCEIELYTRDIVVFNQSAPETGGIILLDTTPTCNQAFGICFISIFFLKSCSAIARKFQDVYKRQTLNRVNSKERSISAKSDRITLYNTIHQQQAKLSHCRANLF